MSYINSHRSSCIGPYSEDEYSSALLQVCPTLLLDDEVATDHICDYSYYNIHNFHARISLCKMLFRPGFKGPWIAVRKFPILGRDFQTNHSTLPKQRSKLDKAVRTNKRLPKKYSQHSLQNHAENPANSQIPRSLYMVQCWPAPPLPPDGMVLVQGPTDASILVSDCHFAAARTACFRGQADLPPPLWCGGFAFFHDCQVLQIFPPRPTCGVVGVLSPKTVSILFCFKQSDLSIPLKCGWLSSFNNCYH